jgi:hypothetical protein
MYSINTVIRFTIVIVYMYNVSPFDIIHHFLCLFSRTASLNWVQK